MKFLNVLYSRYRLLLGIICLSLLLVLFVSSIIANVSILGLGTYATASDFRPFYTSGLMVIHGVKDDFYSYHTQFVWQKKVVQSLPSTAELMPFRNPPVFAGFFGFFALLPYLPAYSIWLFFNGALLCLLTVGVLQLLPQQTWKEKIFVTLAIFTYAPIFITMVQAQVSYILTVALLFGRILFLKKKDFFAGLVLSLLFIKPQYVLLPLLFLLTKRYTKAFLGFLTGLASFSILSFALVGISGMNSYLASILSTLSGKETYMLHDEMPTLQGFFLTLAHTSSLATIQIPWLLCVITTLCLCIYICRKPIDPRGREFDIQWVTLIIATVLLSVFTNFQDLSILIVAGVSLVRWKQLEKRIKIRRLIDFLIIGGYILCLFSSFALKLYHVQIYVPYLCITLLFFAVLSFQQEKQESFQDRI